MRAPEASAGIISSLIRTKYGKKHAGLPKVLRALLEYPQLVLGQNESQIHRESGRRRSKAKNADPLPAPSGSVVAVSSGSVVAATDVFTGAFYPRFLLRRNRHCRLTDFSPEQFSWQDLDCGS